MAIVLDPDGSAREFKYNDFHDATRELGGYFESVGGQVDAGYLCLVHETGAVDGMTRNPAAEILCGYPAIHGKAVIVSFEEAHEHQLLHRVRPIDREAFEQRLRAITKLEPVKA